MIRNFKNYRTHCQQPFHPAHAVSSLFAFLLSPLSFSTRLTVFKCVSCVQHAAHINRINWGLVDLALISATNAAATRVKGNLLPADLCYQAKLFVLVQAVAPYKNRNPATPDEEEYVENVFGALCSCLMDEDTKTRCAVYFNWNLSRLLDYFCESIILVLPYVFSRGWRR